MIFDNFDRIRIVNLASRPDRRREMEFQLERVKLLGDPRVAFFDAIVCPDKGPFLRKGSHGAFHSHLTLLREAAIVNETILILQDDCDFLIPQVLEYRLPAKWDIFYGGYEASTPSNLHDSNIVGAHFMGFSTKAVATAVEYFANYLESDFQPDPRAAAESTFDPHVRPPIDGALVWMRRAHPELETVFAMLGEQRSSRTDIGDQKWFDRIPFLRQSAEVARRLLR